MDVFEVLFFGLGEDEDVVSVDHTEGKIPNDAIHEPLEHFPSITTSKVGVAEREHS